MFHGAWTVVTVTLVFQPKSALSQYPLNASHSAHRLPAPNAHPYLTLREILSTNHKFHIPSFTCPKMQPPKTSQLPNWIVNRAATQVKLHHFVPFPRRLVFHPHKYSRPFRSPLPAQPRILERRIAQPETKSVKWFTFE